MTYIIMFVLFVLGDQYLPADEAVKLLKDNIAEIQKAVWDFVLLIFTQLICNIFVGFCVLLWRKL